MEGENKRKNNTEQFNAGWNWKYQEAKLVLATYLYIKNQFRVKKILRALPEIPSTIDFL